MPATEMSKIFGWVVVPELGMVVDVVLRNGEED